MTGKDNQLKSIFLFLAFSAIGFCLYSKTTRADFSSDKRAIWVGASDRRQFTAEEYDNIAQNYSIVIIAKWHDRSKMASHHEAARELKMRNPDIKVFPYFSGTYRFNSSNYSFPDDEAHRDWFLRDSNGEKIPDYGDGGTALTGYYIDNSNVAYRQWAVNEIIRDWMEKIDYEGKPLYAGVAFDSTHIYNLDDCVDFCGGSCNSTCNAVNNLIDKVGKAKMRDWNAGIRSLLAETKVLLGSERSILFNGVENKAWVRDRSTKLLESADMAWNEDFSYSHQETIPKEEFLGYIDLMLDPRYADKTFIQKPHIANSAELTADQLVKLKRYSLGGFYLGYRPGKSFYKYAEDPVAQTEGQLDKDPVEIYLDLGNPTENAYMDYLNQGNIYGRYFKNGRVYVNMSDSEQSMTFRGDETDFTLMNGGAPGQRYRGGDAITIPAKDAVFMYKTSYLSKPSCRDGTFYGQCSVEKPMFCDDSGKMTKKCSQCGCPDGKACQANGACQPAKKTYRLGDFVKAVKEWLKSGGGLESDVNKDNKVNASDLGIMMSNWEK